MLAYLMIRTSPWASAALRLLAARGAGEESIEGLEARLEEMLEDVRIPARIAIVEVSDFAGMMRESQEATFVFLPFRLREEGMLDTDGQALPASIDGPPMAFVLAASDIDLGSQPDEGQQAEIARAQDAAEQARTLAEKKRTEASRAQEQILELQTQAADVEGESAENVEDLARQIDLTKAASRGSRAQGGQDGDQGRGRRGDPESAGSGHAG